MLSALETGRLSVLRAYCQNNDSDPCTSYSPVAPLHVVRVETMSAVMLALFGPPKLSADNIGRHDQSISGAVNETERAENRVDRSGERA